MDKTQLLTLAESGDIKAIEEVANSYYRGKNGFEEDNDKALLWFQKAVEIDSENVVGLNGIGNIFYNGYGVPVDIEKGATYYLKAATLGYSKAQFNIASHFADEGDSKCIEWYEKAFRGGEYDAACKLGELYADGSIISQDIAKAMQWYIAGADKGDNGSQFHLAIEYHSGEQIPKDPTLAMKWMLAAAEGGNSTAMNNLAVMYAAGDCVEKDFVAGTEWAIKAARAGDSRQLLRYALNYHDGDGFLPHDVEKSIELFKIGAESGDADCMQILALKYLRGEGVPESDEKALHWAEEASKKGNESAINIFLILCKKLYGETANQYFFDALKTGADDGYYECMVRVYQCYHEGLGIEQDNELAIQYLRRAAQGGYRKALFYMGVAYMTGDLVGTPDYPKGIDYYHRIIANGEKDDVTAAASRNLGYAYKEGTGVEPDVNNAIKHFELAAECGDTDAMIQLAAAYSDDGWATLDYPKAAHYFQLLSDVNNPAGMYHLGLAHEKGKGVDLDVQKAFDLYMKAANENYAPACVTLGFAYYEGELVPKDLSKAVSYWEKAAELGDEKAQEFLLKVYEDREFSNAVDHEKAAKFLQPKAECGDIKAMQLLSEQLSELGRYDEANGWSQKAAEGGNADAQYDVGFSAFIAEKYEEAVFWLEKAVAQNHPASMLIMAEMLSQGNCAVVKDESKAFQYYKKSAELGNLLSMYRVGRCYYFGQGTAIDYQLAFRWFDQARQYGCNEMWFELGNCYLHGNGVTKDVAKAIELYQAGVDKQDCNHCRLRLGQIVADNELPCYDPAMATKQLEAVVNIDDFRADAAYTLGMMYLRMKDGTNAMRWLDMAADAGSASGQYNLGVIYFNGEFASKDLERAEHYFALAARNGFQGADKDVDDCRRLRAALQQQSQRLEQSQQNSHQPSNNSNSGGCYVATAVYGSYDCPSVWTLRRFRDYTLAKTWYGRAFIHTYYFISPILVSWFGDTAWFKRMWKPKLDRIVFNLQSRGVECTPYQDHNWDRRR